jgi:hypothetical protein
MRSLAQFVRRQNDIYELVAIHATAVKGLGMIGAQAVIKHRAVTLLYKPNRLW